tara:strand:+ start:15297 stop:16097 length:801 start_codon:yes stop_codon:yes gene_type:complete
MSSTCEGRLTLESGVAVSTTDQTAKTTVYFTPHIGTNISLYDSGDWDIFTFGELSLSISGYTADTNYDIFIYNNSGTLTLQSVAWTDDTNRATDIITLNGVYVLSGATTRRYLGTIRTTATTGQCEDSISRRFVWSYYNQVKKFQRTTHTNTAHTYSSTVWRATNNDTTVGVKRYLMVLGLDTFVSVSVNNHSKFMYTGAALDGTTQSERLDGLSGHNGDPSYNGQTFSFVRQYIAPGYHFIQELEYGVNSSSVGYHTEVAGDHLC